MMKHPASKGVVFAVAALSLITTGTAMAETGSIIRRAEPVATERSAKGGANTREVFDRYAACILERRRGQVRRVLSLPSASKEQDDGLVQLADHDCMIEGQLRFSAALYRGGLFAALVRDRYAKEGAILPAAQLDFTKEFGSATSDPNVAGIAALLNFAGCVIHRDAENSRLAIVGPAGSPRETSAFSALAPALGQCVAQGSTIKFSKGSLIGVLAEAYYRESLAQMAVAGAGALKQ